MHLEDSHLCNICGNIFLCLMRYFKRRYFRTLKGSKKKLICECNFTMIVEVQNQELKYERR